MEETSYSVLLILFTQRWITAVIQEGGLLTAFFLRFFVPVMRKMQRGGLLNFFGREVDDAGYLTHSVRLLLIVA